MECPIDLSSSHLTIALWEWLLSHAAATYTAAINAIYLPCFVGNYVGATISPLLRS
jgi:hypothetical protein